VSHGRSRHHSLPSATTRTTRVEPSRTGGGRFHFVKNNPLQSRIPQPSWGLPSSIKRGRRGEPGDDGAMVVAPQSGLISTLRNLTTPPPYWSAMAPRGNLRAVGGVGSTRISTARLPAAAGRSHCRRRIKKGPRTAGPGWEETYMSKSSVSDSATTSGCKYVTYGTKVRKMYNGRRRCAAAR
jgi:hypothetical protein